MRGAGLALREAGRFAEAIEAHRDAAAIYREIGDRLRELVADSIAFVGQITVRISSLGASSSSVAASHCCRAPAS